MSPGLRFHPAWEAWVLPPDRVYLLAGERRLLLRGPLYAALAGNGLRLPEGAASRFSEAEVLYALERMRARGLLVEGDPPPPGDPGGTWGNVRSFGVAGGEAVARALGPLEGRRVALAADYLDPALEEWARAGAPCLLLGGDARHLRVGPAVGPTCPACLRHRLRGHDPLRALLADLGAHRVAIAPREDPDPDEWIRAARAWLAEGGWEGTLAVVDRATGERTEHRILPVPGCPACGPPSPEPRPLALSPCPRGRPGEPLLDPAELLRRVQPLESRLVGIVAEVRALPVAEGGPWRAVVRACADEPWGGLDRLPLRHPPGGLGRGLTPEEACASALGECLEVYSARRRGRERTLRAAWADLGEEAVHPGLLWLQSPSQAERPDGYYRHRVPPAPGESDVLDWLPAWSLTHGRWRRVPACRVLMDPFGADPLYTAESNGLGAGVTLEEALLHAFLEVVERDSVALWWYSRAVRPGVDAASFGDPRLDGLAGRFRALGREAWALDVTADLGIPAFVALSQAARPSGATPKRCPAEHGRPLRASGAQGQPSLAFGMGAHLDAATALRRAFTENAYGLDLAGEWAGTPDQEALQPWRTARLEDHPWLAPAPTARRAEDYPSLPVPGDLRADLEHALARARDRGLEVLAVDLSRPDVPLRVVRVLVPGMRHFTPAFAPGRLYDVPPELGWVPRRLAEGELNPLPFPA